jgi:hypothetical protein
MDVKTETDKEIQELRRKIENVKAKDEYNEFKRQNKEKNEEIRRNLVTQYFEMFCGREMTDKEYKRYIKKFENPNTPGGFSIYTWCKNKGFLLDKWKPSEELVEEK